ncbi:MAG TPA: hypothetical protein VFS43_08845 [Polyangiaceae bacterium]|nr:hypothetical protein [Polyangiaceae bacterium]
MARRTLRARALLALAGVATASCAQLLGDDFRIGEAGASGAGGGGGGGGSPSGGGGGGGGRMGQGGGGGSSGGGGSGGVLELAIKQIAAGANATCALLNSGELRCWGGGPELGYGRPLNVGDDETPASVEPVAAGGVVTAVSTGGPTCAVFAGGGVRCWGGNANGELGYGNASAVGDDEPPSLVGTLSLSGQATQVASGTSHACALLAGGNVQCWGHGVYGRLGYGSLESVGDDEVPATAGLVGVGERAKQIDLGESHSCALLEGGKVLCWGRNDQGQLGYGHTNVIGDNEAPQSSSFLALGGEVAQISVGGNHACARLVDGAVRCWGANGYGQLGYGTTTNVGDDERPDQLAAPVDLGGAKAIDVGAGYYHTCALLAGGAVRCWGFNASGQLGYGNTNNLLAPGPALDFGGARAVQLAVGNNHACALFDDGFVRCWGDNGYGQLGYGNTENIGDGEPPAAAGAVEVFEAAGGAGGAAGAAGAGASRAGAFESF